MKSTDNIEDLLDGSITDMSLDARGEKAPDKTDKIALIDADTLAYTTCLAVENREELLPEEMYTEKELKEIKEDPGYDEETKSIWHLDINLAMIRAEEKLQLILDRTGCSECELHFSQGRENFRYSVKEDYKANRTSRAPAGLHELKLKLLGKYGGSMSTDWEADDVVVFLKEAHPDKYIMVAVDKDLLYSVEGRHFNYYESAQYNIDMKWVETDADTRMKWPYIQALVGDRVDNIEGVKGIGAKKAPKFYEDCNTPIECWNRTVEIYESKGKTMIDALITLRLVDMHQFNGVEIVLFDPRKLEQGD